MRRRKKARSRHIPFSYSLSVIFVLSSFNSYLKYQPFTARSARTDLYFTKDAQSPFVEDMGPKLWHLGCAALSAGTLSILLAQLCCQCFRTKIILPICLYSILYNLLRASAIQTVNDNKSMWTRLEPQILGAFVICGSWTLVCSCTFDWLHAHNVPGALAMKSKYCLFPIKNNQMVVFPPYSFQGSNSKVKTMTTPMGMRHQITFCNILLKYKTKPWNLGRKRNSLCQMLPNKCSIMNIQMYEKKMPTLKQIVPQNHIWLQQ